MRPIIVAASLFLFTFPAEAQDVCRDIIQHASRDFVSTDQNIAVAYSLYREHCEGENVKKSSSTSVGLDAVVKAVPVSFNLGSGSSEQKVTNFCRTFSEQFASQSNLNIQTSTVVAEALTAFNTCVALANRGVYFDTKITRTQVTVDVSRGGESVQIVGVNYDEQKLDCRVPETDASSDTVKASLDTRKLLQGGSFPITCRRHQTTESDGSSVIPHADLTIMTSRGSFALPLPQDAYLPLRFATEINEAMAILQSKLNHEVKSRQATDERNIEAAAAAEMKFKRALNTCHAPNFSAVGQREVAGRTVFVRRVANVSQGAMDDFGPLGADDQMHIYCVLDNDTAQTGTLAVCLSNEPCPWR